MSEASVMCRACWALVAGVPAGDSVRWVVCDDCVLARPVADLEAPSRLARIARAFLGILTFPNRPRSTP